MNVIEIRDLCKDYGDFHLDHVNLTVPGGSVMGLIGANGAGKSTTINLILDLIRADAGEVRLWGEEIHAAFPAAKQDIAVVLDETCFPLNLSVREVNSILRSAYTNWSEETFFGYVKRFGLPERKKIKEFSRGMKRKLDLAAALSHRAKLLILDEATSGLDPVVRDEMLELFYDFVTDDEHAILISSHITSDLEKICDDVTFLNKGQVALSGNKDDLFARFGLFKGTEEQLEALDPAAVHGLRRGAFGVEALVERARIPQGFTTDVVNLEDIILFLAKEGS